MNRVAEVNLQGSSCKLNYTVVVLGLKVRKRTERWNKRNELRRERDLKCGDNSQLG